MEPAEIEIDWKNIDSQYEPDEAYEHINAPKWLDLSAPDATSVDDVAWFCRPDCRHPVIPEDFNCPKVKIIRSNSKLILSGEQKNDHRDTYLKRKGKIVTFFPSPIKPKLNSKRFGEDLENLNPNREAALREGKEKKAPMMKKESIKSSAEKKHADVDEEEVTGESQNKSIYLDQPKLKSAFSARNLFSGRDILNQISEFCHELKRFATGKESAVAEEEKRKNMEKVNEKACLTDSMEEEKKKKSPVSTKKNGRLIKRCELSVKLESNEEKSRILREPRALPPTPQRFPSPSGHRNLPILKASGNSISSPLGRLPKSKTPERGVLQELNQSRRGEEEKRELIPKNEECNNSSISSVAEGSGVDLFWFLKPCSYLVD